MGATLPEGGLLEALFGKTRCAVLALFFVRPERAFYLRQAARLVGRGLGAVQRELRHLAHAGILCKEVQGQQVYYRANTACPIFGELRGIVVKTAGVADVLREALAPVAGRIRAAFLFGSLVKGIPRASSDVDLMILGDVTFAELVPLLRPAEERVAREVNPAVYSAGEFRLKLTQGHHFLTTVLKDPKVFLIGGEDDLARLAEERLAGPPRTEPARNRRPARRRRA